MGLDVGHAHWSYGGFHHFRLRLAAVEGIPLELMAGFRDDGMEAKPWDEITSDLVPLLHHSDCDGELSPEECARVAPRLEEILSVFPDDDYDRVHGMLLVRSMRECAETGEPLEFS